MRSNITPNGFAGNDSERINLAVRAAAGTGAPAIIPRLNERAGGMRDCWVLDSAILLPSNTTVVLDNCRLKLSDRCRDNFFRSANCGLGIDPIQPLENIHLQGLGHPVLEGAGRPRATGDSGKQLGVHTFGADAGVEGESQGGDWRNLGILLAAVKGFSIRNLCIADSHCWAISLEHCTHGELRDLAFASRGWKEIDGTRQTILNQDGIDLRQGCQDILIENITGFTGDDLIALTGIPHGGTQAGTLGCTMISGLKPCPGERDAICRVMLRNIRGCCPGGHHIIRLLNNSGVQLHDIVIDGVIDTSTTEDRARATIKVGDVGYGGSAPLGDTSRVVISNVISRSRHDILIAGSLTDSILSNIVRHGGPGEPVTYQSGAENVRNVLTSNMVCATGPAPGA